MPTNSIDFDLIDRYLTGACTPEERVQVERLRETDASWRALFAALPSDLDARADQPARLDAEASWRALASEMRRLRRPALVGKGVVARDPTGGRVLSVPTVGVSAARPPAAVAAAVVIALCAGLAVGLAHRGSYSANVGREYATAPGQRLSVTLTDGTRFTLAPASRVRVATDYGRAREVELDGEAYFTVVHDVAKPFTVHASGVVARDVGTSFDVRAYARDAGVRVVVAEGVVAVSGAGCRTSSGTLVPSAVHADACQGELRAGDLAAVREGRLSVTHDADVGALIAWTRGELSFRDAPLDEVAAQLSQWYGVEITIADSTLRARDVSGTFANPSLDGVLDLIAPVVGAQYERHGDRVTLTVAPRATP